MLATRHHTPRNPLFQFHPLHTVFSLVGTLILFGLLVWFLAVPTKVGDAPLQAEDETPPLCLTRAFSDATPLARDVKPW
jgi:hypothetical protein